MSTEVKEKKYKKIPFEMVKGAIVFHTTSARSDERDVVNLLEALLVNSNFLTSFETKT